MGQRFKNPMLSGPGSQYQYDDVFVQNSPLVHHSTPSSLGPSSGASGRSSISHENDIGERMEAAIREIAVLRDKHQGQIDELVEEKNVLIAEIAEIQEALKRLEEKVNANGETSKSSKSVANQHKLLKVSELYGIKMILTSRLPRMLSILCSGTCVILTNHSVSAIVSKS